MGRVVVLKPTVCTHWQAGVLETLWRVFRTPPGSESGGCLQRGELGNVGEPPISLPQNPEWGAGWVTTDSTRQWTGHGVHLLVSGGGPVGGV